MAAFLSPNRMAYLLCKGVLIQDTEGREVPWSAERIATAILGLATGAIASSPPSGMKKILNVYWDDAVGGPVWVISDTPEP